MQPRENDLRPIRRPSLEWLLANPVRPLFPEDHLVIANMIEDLLSVIARVVEYEGDQLRSQLDRNTTVGHLWERLVWAHVEHLRLAIPLFNEPELS